MAHIDIEKDHQLGRDEARKRLREMENKLKERYGVSLAWRGDEADVKATGVTGTINIEENKVAINLTLGLMVRPLAGRIREAMERHQVTLVVPEIGARRDPTYEFDGPIDGLVKEVLRVGLMVSGRLRVPAKVRLG